MPDTTEARMSIIPGYLHLSLVLWLAPCYRLCHRLGPDVVLGLVPCLGFAVRAAHKEGRESHFQVGQLSQGSKFLSVVTHP